MIRYGPIRASVRGIRLLRGPPKEAALFNKILTLNKTSRLTCRWVATGNARNPFACVWAEGNTRGAAKVAPSPKEDSGRMRLCA
jgi:hypothetical protein